VKKKITVLQLCAMLLALSVPAEAQQQIKKLHRIGILLVGSSSFYSAWIDVFRQGLKELGYIEGKNIAIEYRYAEGKADLLPSLAAELVDLKVDVVFTSSTPSVLAVKKATSTIPIVFVSISDPVASGSSLASHDQAGTSQG
jgi:ABC-type uncharacterized transport system substrate-binding protein